MGMKLFTLLVVLMALIAAIEAAPMDEDPMGDFMEDPEESMDDYEADSMDKESMDEDAAESDNEKDESEDEDDEEETFEASELMVEPGGYKKEPLNRRKRSTYSQAYQYPQYGYDPYLALRSYSSHNPYNQAYRSWQPSGLSNQAYRSWQPSGLSNQAYRSWQPSGLS